MKYIPKGYIYASYKDTPRLTEIINELLYRVKYMDISQQFSYLQHALEACNYFNFFHPELIGFVSQLIEKDGPKSKYQCIQTLKSLILFDTQKYTLIESIITTLF